MTARPVLAIPVGRSSVTLGMIAGPWVTVIDEPIAVGGFLAFALGLHRRF